MTLMPAYFTTSNLRKRKAKKKTQKQLQAEAQHEKFLKKLGYKPLDKTAKSVVQYSPNYNIRYTPREEDTKVLPPTSDKIPGHMAKKESMQYSGERKLIGIATMHKSNMVPIFADNKEVAIDIARMRR
jgi:hypothetical protein